MFESWYILKFDYTLPATSVTQTKSLGYMHLDDAEEMFKKLEFSYQYDTPMRINGDIFIKIVKAALHEVFDFDRRDAIADVDLGKGNILFETQPIDIDIT